MRRDGNPTMIMIAVSHVRALCQSPPKVTSLMDLHTRHVFPQGNRVGGGGYNAKTSVSRVKPYDEMPNEDENSGPICAFFGRTRV